MEWKGKRKTIDLNSLPPYQHTQWRNWFVGGIKVDLKLLSSHLSKRHFRHLIWCVVCYPQSEKNIFRISLFFPFPSTHIFRFSSANNDIKNWRHHKLETNTRRKKTRSSVENWKFHFISKETSCWVVFVCASTSTIGLLLMHMPTRRWFWI